MCITRTEAHELKKRYEKRLMKIDGVIDVTVVGVKKDATLCVRARKETLTFSQLSDIINVEMNAVFEVEYEV